MVIPAAKETKPREKGCRESERLIVPLKVGNRPEGPTGGMGAPDYGTAGGTDDRCIGT